MCKNKRQLFSIYQQALLFLTPETLKLQWDQKGDGKVLTCRDSRSVTRAFIAALRGERRVECEKLSALGEKATLREQRKRKADINLVNGNIKALSLVCNIHARELCAANCAQTQTLTQERNPCAGVLVPLGLI
jgi:hypothetical protein